MIKYQGIETLLFKLNKSYICKITTINIWFFQNVNYFIIVLEIIIFKSTWSVIRYMIFKIIISNYIMQLCMCFVGLHAVLWRLWQGLPHGLPRAGSRRQADWCVSNFQRL